MLLAADATTTILQSGAFITATGTFIAVIAGIVRNRGKDRTEESSAKRDDERDDFQAVVDEVWKLFGAEKQARLDSETRCNEQLERAKQECNQRIDALEARISQHESSERAQGRGKE